MTKCPTPNHIVTPDGKRIEVSCKSWSCPVCSKTRKKRLIDRFRHGCGINSGGFRYRMITLTEVKHPDNESNAREIMKHWNRLRASLRKNGHPLTNYFWTREYKPLYGSDSPIMYPHLHVAIKASIPYALLQRLWLLASGASRVHVPTDEEVNKLCDPVAYMSKYLTKSDMNDGFKKGERRYGFSRTGFPNYNVEHTYKIPTFEGEKEFTYKPYKALPGSLFVMGSIDRVIGRIKAGITVLTGIIPDVPYDDVLWDNLSWEDRRKQRDEARSYIHLDKLSDEEWRKWCNPTF